MYIAASASRIMSSASAVDPCSATEMPRLPRSASSLWPATTGSASASRMRSAASAASWLLAMSSSSTANSSPPKRAAVSAPRMLWSRRRATSCRTSSPAAWPRLSLIVLKSSRSRKMTARPRSSRRLRASAWRTRSVNKARLARPVTPSWNAWWASCSSNALRSLTSRLLSTIPPTCASWSRLVIRISNWRVSPSLWVSPHSTACDGSPVPVAPEATRWARRWRSAGVTRSEKRRPDISAGV